LAAIATQRFSALGVFAVATLLISGFLNAYFLVGSFEALANTTYGRLVALKVGLFVVIVSIAAVNRLKLRPRLSVDRDWGDTAKDALSTLRRNVIAELCLGAAILAAVAALGLTPPSVHRHEQMEHQPDHSHHK
jgi:putative copper resistance protein D